MIKIKTVNAITASTEPSLETKTLVRTKPSTNTKPTCDRLASALGSFKIRLKPSNDKSIRLFHKLIAYLKSREKEFNRWGIKLKVYKNVVYLNYIEPSCAYWAFRPKGISSIAIYWYNGGPSSVCEASLAIFKSYNNLVDFINYNIKLDKTKE